MSHGYRPADCITEPVGAHHASFWFGTAANPYPQESRHIVGLLFHYFCRNFCSRDCASRRAPSFRIFTVCDVGAVGFSFCRPTPGIVPLRNVRIGTDGIHLIGAICGGGFTHLFAFGGRVLAPDVARINIDS